VADTGNSRIQKFDAKGKFLLTFGTEVFGNGQFSIPFGIAVDSTSNLYVADTGNSRMQVFATDTDGDGVPDHEDNSLTIATPD
jgi:DNA-binding beta-propeller fold protein YncE